MVFLYLLLLLGSYILGAIPTGYIITKLVKKVDVREYGSGNIGATNVYRVLGIKWALVVVLLDILKGVIPILAGMAVLESEILIILLGIVAIMGHNWTIFLGFKGGRGVATAGGVIFTLMPLPSFIGLIIWLTVVWVSRYVSLGSLAIAIVVPFLVFFLEDSMTYTYFTIVMALFVIIQHRENIKRLLEGNENRI